MPKSPVQRFDSALTALWAFCEKRHSYGAYFAVLKWLGSQSPAARSTVGGKIGLDTKKFQESERELLRALLLLSATAGGKSDAALTSLKQEMLGAVPLLFGHKVEMALSVLMAKFPVIAGAGVIDASLRTKLTQLAFPEQTVLTSFEQARFLISKTKALMQGSTVDNLYEKWFGPIVGARWNTVKGNIEKLSTAMYTKPVVLQYEDRPDFGSSPVQEHGVFQTRPSANVALGQKFFTGSAAAVAKPMIFDETRFAGAMQTATALGQEEERLLIAMQEQLEGIYGQERITRRDKLQKEITDGIKAKRVAALGAFQETNVYAYSTILIHELTHNIVGTTDWVVEGTTMYGYNLCRWLAKNHPGKAIGNADNYRLFCDEVRAL